MRVSWRELAVFARTHRRGDLRETPLCVGNFVSAYLAPNSPVAAYDPWVGLGSAGLLAQLLEEGRLTGAVGIVPNADEHAVLLVGRKLERLDKVIECFSDRPAQDPTFTRLSLLRDVGRISC